MSEQAFFWILGIGGAIIAGVVGALWKHITADSDHREKTAERLGRIEQQLGQHAEEVKGLRDGRHEFREQITRLFADLRQEVRDRLSDAVEAVRRWKDG